MRISDWSSDVCSSDLRSMLYHTFLLSRHGCSWHGGGSGTFHAKTLEVLSICRIQLGGGCRSAQPALLACVVPERNHGRAHIQRKKIGRASGRERGWRNVSSSVVAG